MKKRITIVEFIAALMFLCAAITPILYIISGQPIIVKQNTSDPLYNEYIQWKLNMGYMFDFETWKSLRESGNLPATPEP
jgi:hypothetical protein